MKKLFTVMLLAFLALSYGFAASPNTGTETLSSTVTTTVNLTVAEEEVNSFNIGFSSENSTTLGPSATPAALTSIDMEYKRSTGASSTTGNYIYYYIETSTAPTLTLKAGGGLESESVADTKIEYTLSVGKSTSVSGASPEGITLDLVSTSKKAGVLDGYIGFEVEVTGTVTSAMVASNWTDTISLTIAPEA